MTTTENIIEVERSIARNMTIVRLLGVRVLFSYTKPSAFQKADNARLVFYTLEKFSKTSTKHLHDFLLQFEDQHHVPVHPNVFSAWLYESLQDTVKKFSF